MKNRRYCQDHTTATKPKEEGLDSNTALAITGLGIWIIMWGFILFDMYVG